MRSILIAILLSLLPVVATAEDNELSAEAGRYADFYLEYPSLIAEADSLLGRTRIALSDLIRDSLRYRPQIYVVKRQWQFDSLTGGSIPDWGAAVAIPYRRRIVIKSPYDFNLGKSFSELLIHEYTHLVLHQRTGLHDPPRWLDEGMCKMVSSEWGWSDNLTMARAVLFGNLIPLAEIERVNRFSASESHVAYATSYLAVKYLFDEYGNNAVNTLLDRVASGDSLDAALQAATGSDYADFNRELNDFLRRRYNLASIFIDMIYIWIILAVVVVIGAVLSYRKRRKYYQEWERQERLESTDFDYGDPDAPEVSDDDEPWRG